MDVKLDFTVEEQEWLRTMAESVGQTLEEWIKDVVIDAYAHVNFMRMF